MKILQKLTKRKMRINLTNGKVNIKKSTEAQERSMISPIQKDAVQWDQLLDWL